jgi:hypothetical protein
VSEKIWLVTFMDYDLGYFDDQTCRLEPLENPFGRAGQAERLCSLEIDGQFNRRWLQQHRAR